MIIPNISGKIKNVPNHQPDDDDDDDDDADDDDDDDDDDDVPTAAIPCH